jgi:hypothetical protein
VRPLSFLLFTTKSPSSFPNPSFSLFFSRCTPPLCHLLHASIHTSSHRPQCPRWPFLAPPRRAGVPNSCHAALPDPPAPPVVCTGWVNSFSLPSPCYKTGPSSILLLFLPLSSFLATTKNRAAAAPFSPEIRRELSPPLKFLQPTASLPPSLAPRPDPVQLRPSPSPDLPQPEPPFTGAAQARPRRRQRAPPPLRPIQVRESLLPCPLVLVRALVLHVRRPFAGNGVAPPRPLQLSAADHAPRSPVEYYPSPSFLWTL